MIWMAWPTAGGAGMAKMPDRPAGRLDPEQRQVRSAGRGSDPAAESALLGGAFRRDDDRPRRRKLPARPTEEGQPLEGRVRDDLLLAEVEKLRNGEFDEELLQSTIANYKRRQMQIMDSNQGAVRWLPSWTPSPTAPTGPTRVTALDRLEKITQRAR